VSRCPVLRVAVDGRELVLDRAIELTVGRDAGADLELAEPRVSRRHLVLRPGSHGWVLEDVGSTNGTFHEGRRVSLLRIDRPMRLRLGDPDDGVELRVEPDATAVVGAATPAPAQDTAPAAVQGPLRLGRAGDNDVVIRDPTVSGHHAELVGDPETGLDLVDLGSRNGTFVNGQRVGRTRLRGSDRIGIGYHEFRLVPAAGGGYSLVQSVDPAEWWRLTATLAISALTVLGACLALWSAYLGSRAVDGDRRAVLETMRVQQQQVADDTRVHAEASLAAGYRATLAEIDVLEREAAQARRDARPAVAAELADRARLEGAVARQLRQLFPAEALRGKGARARFEVATRRQALAGATLQAQETAQLNPDLTAGQAGQARRRSVWLQAWSVALVVVLAVLTLARLSEPVRPWLVVTGVLLLVAVAVTAALTVVG
jgi:pSer/pThr/pTyr-binding forkhead associated (FHA) protein